jgi:hypothetical protein
MHSETRSAPSPADAQIQPGPVSAGQCWADYIITMSGIDLRQAQVPPAIEEMARNLQSFGSR